MESELFKIKAETFGSYNNLNSRMIKANQPNKGKGFREMI